MERREFLTAGTIVGVGALTEEGCATLGNLHPAEVSDVDDMDAYVATIDRLMAAIQTGSMAEDFRRALPAQERAPEPARAEAGEALARKTLRVLVLTGMFLDLNERDREHPAIQRRMKAAMDEMDDAVLGNAELLRRLDDDGRARLRGKFQRDPSLAMRITELLDTKGAEFGVPPKRMRHLRGLMAEIGWRLRNQDPAILIDPFLEQVGKAQAQTQPHDPDDPARSTQAPGAALASPSQQTDGERSGPSRAAPPSAPRASAAPLPPRYAPADPEPAPAQPRRGSGSTTRVGLWMMGLSVLTGGVGALIVALGGGIGGAVVITVGVLGLLVGLIVTLVGAIIDA